MHIHTHLKKLLALNTVHVPVFLHTRTQQLRVATDEKYSGCMCTLANRIKIINLFKYEKNAIKYSLFELSTPNNSMYIEATKRELIRLYRLFKREIKTPARPWHCRDTSEVKFRHFSPAMSPVYPAPRGPGIQMTGALQHCFFESKNLGTLQYLRNEIEPLCDKSIQLGFAPYKDLLSLHHPLETTFFCKLPCSKTPTYKSDLVIFYIAKILEIGLQIKI